MSSAPILPTVPFPSDGLRPCSGCGLAIGWVKTVTGKPCPVEAKGYCGPEGGPRRGYTREGRNTSVTPMPPGTTIQPGWQVIYETHFAHCAKADRFRRAARVRQARDDS